MPKTIDPKEYARRELAKAIRWSMLAGLLFLALGCVQPGEAQPIGPTPTEAPLSEVVDAPMCNRLTQSLAAYGSGGITKSDHHQVVKGLWLQIAKDNRPTNDQEYRYMQKGLDVIFDKGGQEADKYISSLMWVCAQRTQ